MDSDWFDSDSDSDGFPIDDNDNSWQQCLRPKQMNWRSQNAHDLQKARQMLKSPIPDSIVQRLSDLAKINGYNILRDALKAGLTDVAKGMLKFGARVNNVTGNAVDSPLHFAVQQGNTEIVQLLLSKGAKTYATNKTGETPLFIAVKEKNVDVIRLLVAQNANVNATNSEGMTPLHYSVPSFCWQSQGDKTGKIARLLLSLGANVNAKTNENKTALAVAFQRGHTEVVKALLEFKADVNVCAAGNKSLLFVSVDKGDADLTLLLLNNGAHVNARSMSDQCTPLHTAVREIRESVVKVLLGRPDIEVDSKTNQGETALHIAARTGTGSHTIVTALIERGADVNVGDDTGRSALQVALAEHKITKTDFFSLFLTANTQVNSGDVNKKTPLHYAVERNLVTFLRVLLDHGADINLTDHIGRSPLHYTALNDSSKSAVTLLKHGSNINLQDNNGQTLLHLIFNEMQWIERDKVPTLLNFGAETNVQEKIGMTPLHVALKSNTMYRGSYLTFLDRLLAHGAKVNVKDDDGKTPLHHAAAKCIADFILSRLLNHGADINDVDSEGQTALHIASGSRLEREDILNLMHRGADPNIKDVNGKIPLHIAIESGLDLNVSILMNRIAESVIKDNSGKTLLHYFAKSTELPLRYMLALLNEGVDVNSKDNEGNTPLQVALEYSDERMVLFLMEHGADTKVKDNSGKTPLHHAAKRGMVTVLSALLKRGLYVNAKDTEGKSPLHICAETGYQVTGCNMNLNDYFVKNCTVKEGHCGIASLLLTHGADVDCIDKCGKTALYLAAERDLMDLVMKLLKFGADVNVRASVFPKHTPLKCSKTTAVKGKLQEHIVMLCALNLPVDEMNLKSIDFTSSHLQKFRTQCDNEITRCTEVKLVNGDRAISLHDILVRNRKNVYYFFKNGIRSGVSDSLILKLRSFPILGNLIALHFDLAVQRVRLMNEATVLLGDVFSIPPGICVEAITDFLRNVDLKSLIIACRSN